MSPRKTLSRDKILSAAIRYADAHGVDGLTMRQTADELGCGVMSLYNHVSNKDEMLEHMLDAVIAGVKLPGDGPWKDELRASAASANAVLLEHPWSVGEWIKRMPGPNRTRYMDAILRVLTQGGLSPTLVYRGYHAVTMHIVGFTQQQVAYRAVLDGALEELATAFIDQMEGEFPHMAEHVRGHLSAQHDDDGEFAFVLDLILDGLERANAH